MNNYKRHSPSLGLQCKVYSPIHNFGCDLSDQQTWDLLKLGLKGDTLAES